MSKPRDERFLACRFCPVVGLFVVYPMRPDGKYGDQGLTLAYHVAAAHPELFGIDIEEEQRKRRVAAEERELWNRRN